MILIDIITFNSAVLLSIIFWIVWFILSFVMTVMLFRRHDQSNILDILTKGKYTLYHSFDGNIVEKNASGKQRFEATAWFSAVLLFLWPFATVCIIIYHILGTTSKFLYSAYSKGIGMVPHITVNVGNEKES